MSTLPAPDPRDCVREVLPSRARTSSRGGALATRSVWWFSAATSALTRGLGALDTGVVGRA